MRIRAFSAAKAGFPALCMFKWARRPWMFITNVVVGSRRADYIAFIICVSHTHTGGADSREVNAGEWDLSPV